MAVEADYVGGSDSILKTVEAAVQVNEIHQMADGACGYYDNSVAASSGQANRLFKTTGQIVAPKTASQVFLPGGDAYWDRGTNAFTYTGGANRFLAGSFVNDAASADTTCTVNLNRLARRKLDLLAMPNTQTPIGTRALGGLGIEMHGGCANMVLSSTSEAQKLDMLSKDSLAAGLENAIIEMIFAVPSDGAGSAVDVSVGIASATHATDADSIAQHLFMHLDANNTNIYFQSKDGTHTQAAVDSGADYTEGAGNRVEVWLDCRIPASVKIYVNAVRVLSGSTFDLSAAVAVWYLLAHIKKTSSADTYQFDLEKLIARTAEQ